ncbi:uncharacterized protein LOC114755052 [Neltuma alba]|uniref:uncharacterized protein LOC114755052 n=1 Tax=Neltuma alba TaxID=207710 RepID=UPI0010A48E61|nr:uncharacterized protein LOC114755052 [Prosopis alba]
MWDGNLLFENEMELERGVKVTDTAMGPHIEFSEEERRRLEQKWQNTLIIKLLGGRLGFMQMKRKVQQMWGKAGNVELNVIGNGYMSATFQDWDDYHFALEGGPWIIQNHYLTIQTWKRNFNPWTEKIKRIAVWVRLPGLPRDYYDKKFFYHLGNKIGKAIKVDEMTLTRARTMYARMCVEIDLNAPLLPAYIVDGNHLKIEYEGLQLICFACGRFGHDKEHCLTKTQKEHQGEKEQRTPQENTQLVGEVSPAKNPEKVTEEKFWEWMIAQYPRRGRKVAGREGKSTEQQKKKLSEEYRKKWKNPQDSPF